MRLIRLFNDRDTLRLTDACSYLGVAHSTAHRLLAMLIHHGFVQQDPQSRTYRPGPTLLEIGLAVVEKSDFRTKARPLLVELVELFDETVHLMTLEGTKVRYVDAVEGTRALRVAPRTGGLLPAHCTSGGKALLAELPDERIRAMYADPASLTPQTDRSVSSLPSLIAALEEVRCQRLRHQLRGERGGRRIGGDRAAATPAASRWRRSRSRCPPRGSVRRSAGRSPRC